MEKNCALIVAGGKGKRMNMGINKLFLEIDEKPILAFTLEVFEKSNHIDEIILVSAEDEVAYCKNEIIDKYNIKKVSKVVCGGNERQQSVLNGLQEIEDCNIVLIHDGARPFVDENMISQGIKYANMYGASACGVQPKDTIKIKDDLGFSKGTLNRDELFCVQTPQCFKLDIIKKAHLRAAEESFIVTDDTMLVEKYNNKVFLYEGSYNNIKITTPEDLIISERLVNALLT